MTSYASPAGERWYKDALAHSETFPFSFTCGGVRYDGFSREIFTLLSHTQAADAKKRCDTLVWALDSLKTTLETAFYPAYGVSEWTVWLENTGTENSPILSDFESRLTFEGERPVLRGILGDHENHYQPYVRDLLAESVHFESLSGRPTHVNFPYFNLECGDGGAMLVIGWAGTWSADFEAVPGGAVCTARSTVGLHTYLKPGEKIRSALFVRAPYTVRDENYATNFWRSWFVNCNLPAADASGAHVEPFSTGFLALDTGLPNSDGSISERWFTWRRSMEKMLAEDVKVDFRWFDAGWYEAPDGSSPFSDWWGTVGTWKLDPVKWPGTSFRESTDFARQHGMRTLMWFEPERVTDPESLAARHGYDLRWAIRREGARAISNNIGDPDCYAWTVGRICDVLRENRVDMYREDNNSDPGELWRYLDSLEGKDRRGITECRFIIGHYRMWDDIIACTLSFGGCGFVDSCASGGGRNDLESLRRGIPMLRSDYDRTATSIRLAMTTSFNKWIPFCGANTREKRNALGPRGVSDPYVWRCSYLPALNIDSQYFFAEEKDFDNLRFGLKEWKRLSPYLLKDFYVHTDWHSQYEKDGFTAYSFIDPDTGRGALLAFRMEECAEDTLTLQLPYGKEASLRLTDEDSGDVMTLSAGEPVTLVMPEPRTARLLWVETK